MKRKLGFLTIPIFICFSIVACKESDDGTKKTTEGDSTPLYPIDLTMNLQKGQKLCNASTVITGLIAWLPGTIKEDCIEFKSVYFGCKDDITPHPDAGVPESEDEAVGSDTNTSDYDFDCDPGVRRTIILKKGDEVVFEGDSLDDPINSVIEPPFRFCVGDGQVDVMLTIDAGTPVENIDQISLRYWNVNDEGELTNDAEFEEDIEYIVSDDGCILFP